MAYRGRYSNQHSQGLNPQITNFFDMRSDFGSGDRSYFDRKDFRYDARNSPYASKSTPHRESFMPTNSSFNNESSKYHDDGQSALFGIERRNQDRLFSGSDLKMRNSPWRDISHNFEKNSQQQSNYSQSRPVASLFDFSDSQRSGRQFERYSGMQDSYLKSEGNQEFMSNSYRQSYQDNLELKFEQGNTRLDFDRRNNDIFGPRADNNAPNFDRDRFRKNNKNLYERKQMNKIKQSPLSRDRGRGRGQRFENRNRGSLNSSGPQKSQQFTFAKQENVSTEVKKDNPEKRQEKTEEYEEDTEEHDSPEENEGGNAEETENEYQYKKVNLFIPDQSCDKYTFYPPSAEEMGQMFDDMVIFYMFNLKNVLEKNPFVIVCESFRRSEKYDNLQVEDGYLANQTHVKICTLRYHGMMMVRGAGENGCIKEPRVRAGIDLINKLAKSCFTLKMKTHYFSSTFLPEMLRVKECPGVFKVVSEEEAPLNLESSLAYVDNFFKGDSDCELVFPQTKSITFYKNMKWGLRNKGYSTRALTFKDAAALVVSKTRTPQYWRDKIFASGSLETERYKLIPPTGMRDSLYPEKFNIATFIPKMNNRPVAEPSITVYGPPTEGGPKIVRALPPWERHDGKKRRGMGKKNQQKFNKGIRQIQSGVKIKTAMKPFRFLNKSRKKKIKQKLQMYVPK